MRRAAGLFLRATGQRWGSLDHPMGYRTQFDASPSRWLQRISSHLEVFDLIRIDHFRGFEACWEIPAGESTAMNGHWVKVPGEALFTMPPKTASVSCRWWPKTWA